MYKLVRLICDCMDEFSVIGYKIFTNEEYDLWIAKLKSLDSKFENVEMYVGTNEYCEFADFDDYFGNLEIIDLSENEKTIFVDKLGEEFGLFIDPVEHIEEDNE